jgi:hypothetical protein
VKPPKLYERLLKTSPVEVMVNADQLAWLNESALYLRCTAGEFLLATAFLFAEEERDTSWEHAGAAMEALQCFCFEGKTPNCSPRNAFLNHGEMGEHTTQEAHTAADDKLMRRLGLPTTAETLREWKAERGMEVRHEA